jgi:hypothetical protein
MSIEMDIEALYESLVEWHAQARELSKNRLADHIDYLIAYLEMEEL